MENIIPGIQDVHVYFDDVGFLFLGVDTPDASLNHYPLQISRQCLCDYLTETGFITGQLQDI